MGTAVRAAFVMEQTLGHVTHHQNLATAVQRQSAVVATWLPVPFGTSAVGRLVPGFGNWSVRASYRARRQLGRLLAERRHDAIFFHTQVTSLFSVDLMRRYPTVISLDATPENYDTVGEAYGHRPASASWLDRRKHDMNRSAFSTARALVTWSAWAKSSLVTDYGVAPDKVTVLAPGAAKPYFDIGGRRARPAPTDRPVRFLFVGGDFVRKGGPSLLEAVRAARTQRPIELHVVTHDAIAPQPGVVIHRGVRPNTPALFQLFAEADVFVLPSRGECLSVVLMEAGAAGLPIIATNVGALDEAARDGENAIVVRPGSVTDLRAALERLADDDGLRSRLGANAFALAVDRFDAERNDHEIVRLVSRVAAAPDARRVA